MTLPHWIFCFCSNKYITNYLGEPGGSNRSRASNSLQAGAHFYISYVVTGISY